MEHSPGEELTIYLSLRYEIHKKALTSVREIADEMYVDLIGRWQRA